MDFARQELEQNIREGSAQNLYANYKRLLEVFKNDGAMAFDGIIVPILNALIEAKRFEQTEEIFKITRLILKPERDKTLFANLNILEARVRQIRSGGGTIKD